LAIAFLLVLVATPLAVFSKRKGIPVWLTFLGLIVVSAGLMSLIGSFVTVDNFDLANEIPRYQQRIASGTGPVVKAAAKLGFDLNSISSEDIGSLVAKGVMAVLSAVRTIFSEALLALILVMFLVQSRSGIIAAIERKQGADELARLQETFRRIQGDILAYFGTKALMSLGTALGSVIMLFLFGAQYVAISALLVFALNFIPVIGSAIAVLILVVLYAATAGFSLNVLWYSLALMAVQVLFGNILEPRIAGKRLKMSPIVILISLYVWGWIWGVVGMMLSVPLTIVIMIIVKHFRARQSPESVPE
jgi:predicted PurR-regulated permease PerM